VSGAAREPRKRILATERLVLDELTLDDAPFALELTNDPDVLCFVGDKGVRDLDGARRYLADGPIASYTAHGFGLWRVAAKVGGMPLGMCGLLKRETLDDPDIGYAFLAAHRGRGYAREAAAGVMEHARIALGKTRVVAMTVPGNLRSETLLQGLGFGFERDVFLEPDGTQVRLFGWEAAG
jgi:RimJ/RimL family protein N-acetyltransferase